ncbi:hypothetical protein BS17DRAFT_323494 [Gyrodon lividus]|nr:hypothetical protein BS17DRAFT_323494 [Gyrodon lividus]
MTASVALLILDACISLTCLYTSCWLYSRTIQRLPLPSPNPHPHPHPRAYILTNKVTHARLLPAHSKHAFTYPTLSLLLSLDALESGSLDLPVRLGWGWTLLYLFRFGTIWGTVIGLRGDGYLGGGSDDGGTYHAEKGNVEKTSLVSIRRKLDRVLLDRAEVKTPSEIRDVWMMSMPSICTFEGINPLTVYFCYRPSGEVGIVILEVHNTFGEGHVYVMKVGKDENPAPPRGYLSSPSPILTNSPPHRYDHQWTFPRRFFVSPFNDRSGFYTVSIKLPSHPPFHLPSSSSSLNHYNPPKPQIRIHWHMQSPSSSSATTSFISLSIPTSPNSDRHIIGPLKFLAHLSPQISTPLTTPHLLTALSRLPLALFLTLPRILYEASVVHYRKGLRVVGRPEATPAQVYGARKHGAVAESNPPSPAGGADRDHPGGIIYQNPTLLERYARHRMRAFLEQRCIETGVRVVLVPGDPWAEVLTFGPGCSPTTPKATTAAELSLTEARQLTSNETLIISYTSPRIFTLFLTSPSAFLFFRAGCTSKTDGERPLFAVASEGAFMHVFEPELCVCATGVESDEEWRGRNGSGWLERTTQWMRRMPLPRSSLLESHHPTHVHVHPLHAFPSSLRTRLLDLLIISTLLLRDWVEERVFDALGVRFVEGTEPWGRYVWGRAFAVDVRL